MAEWKSRSRIAKEKTRGESESMGSRNFAETMKGEILTRKARPGDLISMLPGTVPKEDGGYIQ